MDIKRFPIGESVTYFGIKYTFIKKYSDGKYKVKVSGYGKPVTNIRVGANIYDITKTMGDNTLMVRKRT